MTFLYVYKRAAPAHTPARPPRSYDCVGGRAGVWAGAIIGFMAP